VEPVPATVRKICLRQNRIKEIEPLECFAWLVELDLYDNGIERISHLERCNQLYILDLSFNRLRKIEGLGTLTKLEALYLSSNQIEIIEGLETLYELRTLELGANRIKKVEGLVHCHQLEQLFLSRNLINELPASCFASISCLRVLALQNNPITRLDDAMKGLPCLEELYVSNCKLESLAGLDHIASTLWVLDIAGNALVSFKGLPERMPELMEFWANSNLIADWDELKQLAHGRCPRLATVYLEGNPIAKHPRYVAMVRDYAPYLRQIDATILKW